MKNFKIRIKLLSESIFGNGTSESSGVDIDILRDDIGVPYFKGKTFKGKLRQEIHALKEYISYFSKNKYEKIVEGLLGKEGEFDSNTLKFSNCVISNFVHSNLEYGIENRKFTKEDVLNALTEIRTFTSLDENGVPQKHSLRKARVIKKGLILYCNVECQRDLSNSEKGILSAGVAALRNLGTMESRGKGNVKCSLMENGEDVTLKYINMLEKEV
jgi:CRISPR/Cas system CSM-associated protein Csm3 (group 7 of RAMP superfamily)